MGSPIRTADVRDRVVRVIAHYLGYAEDCVQDDKTVVDIDPNHDSLSALELVMEFEDEFGISLSDADAEKIIGRPVGEIAAWFDQHLAAKENA